MNPDASQLKLVCPCSGGTERALIFELRDLGALNITRHPGAVSCEGPVELIPQINVFSRVAQRVLIPLFQGAAESPEQLVESLSTIAFEEWLDEHTTFAVRAHLRDVPWNHTHYAAQRVKDIIVDRLRDRGKSRPNVDAQKPRVRFVLHWTRDELSLSVDTTGESLHRRGYRPSQAKAPLKETFAAALLAIGHADPARPFLDPCCGSGTLGVEQAWRALRRAPGLKRRFAFQGWRRGPLSELSPILQSVREQARDQQLNQLPAPIFMSDHNAKAVESTRESLRSAGLEGLVEVRQADARALECASLTRPVIFSNLPYGERMGGGRLQLEGFYRDLGERLARIEDARIVLLCGHSRLPSLMPRLGRAGRRWSLRNGPLNVVLYRWDPSR